MQNNGRMISTAGSILPFIHELRANPTSSDSEVNWGRCLKFDPAPRLTPDQGGSPSCPTPFTDPEAA
jgi:hypothetical protein